MVMYYGLWLRSFKALDEIQDSNLNGNMKRFVYCCPGSNQPLPRMICVALGRFLLPPEDSGEDSVLSAKRLHCVSCASSLC